MERAMVAVVGALLLLAGFAAPGECMNCYPGPAQCAPPRTLVTKMVPCVRTEIVAEVQPCHASCPSQENRLQDAKRHAERNPSRISLRQDPCTKCCPQPFCQVVQQKVPYVYYEPAPMPS